MPIPKPLSAESEQEFISRCIQAIYDEYGQEQSSAICYNTWRERLSKMTSEERVLTKIRGINLQGLEDACWEGYEAIGTKIVDGRIVPNCVPIEE